jgi:2-succinyl-6-hydroxy-2,4-cyclohexadiene-1-carboxylate synthase
MLKELFENDHIFIEKENLTYRDFYKLCLENAHRISNKEKIVSLSVDNKLTDLIDIFSLWILNKSILLHSTATPESDRIKINKSIGAETLKKENTQFNNTISEIDEIESIACYILTSGSTDGPKPIALSFKNLMSAATNFNNFYKVTSEHYLPINLPIYHIGGLMIAIRSLFANASLDIISPGSLSNKDFRKAPNFLSVVPTQMDRILKSDALDFFRKTIFILGGAKAPKKLLKEISNQSLFASSTYGMTETTAMCLATTPSSDIETLLTVGRPLGNTKLSFSDEETLIIESDCVSPLLKGKIQTNDIATQDKDGNYIISGRADDVFISGGENINPLEIQETLFEAGVSDCTVVSIPDEELQEASVLFYPASFKKEEVIKACKENLHKHKVPRHFFKKNDLTTGIKEKKSILKSLAKTLVEIEKISTDIPYICAGDPSKEWLFFIHGFMGSKEDWGSIFSNLQNDFFLIAIDCPGHGENVAKDNLTLKSFINDLNYFINNLDNTVHLIGYSQGARLALGSVLSGAKVKSLTLESGSVGIVDENEREKRYKADLNMFLSVNSKSELLEFFEYWYSNPLFGNFSKHPTYIETIKKKLNHDPKQWQLALKSFSVGLQDNYRPYLKAIDIPKLTICGQKDHKYFAQSKELETQFDFSFEAVKDVSHNTHFEAPQEFCDIILKYWGTQNVHPRK